MSYLHQYSHISGVNRPSSERTTGSAREPSLAGGVASAPSTRVAGEAGDATKIAAGRSVQILLKREIYGSVNVSRKSVYGAAVAMPQIARSSGWSRTFTALAIRSMLHLALNYLLVYMILYELVIKEVVLDYYSGRMHLCTFGRNFETCNGNSANANCVGPGGTNFTTPTLYASFGVWSTRTFVRDSLSTILPEKSDSIQQTVIPGEYGIESWLCRWLCLFVFIMQIVDDLLETMAMVRMLRFIPSAAEPWIAYEPPNWPEGKEKAKEMLGQSEMDFVRISVKGMPLHWKLLNAVFVVFPKLVLWILLAIGGGIFLMETADIQSVIMNSMALSFLLNIDELLAGRLCTKATQTIMEKIKQFDLYDLSNEEGLSDQEIIESFDNQSRQWSLCNRQLLKMLIPKRLLVILFLTFIVYLAYFERFCEYRGDGSYVSEPLYPAQEVQKFGLWIIRWAIAPETIERVQMPIWEMPDKMGKADVPIWMRMR